MDNADTLIRAILNKLTVYWLADVSLAIYMKI